MGHVNKTLRTLLRNQQFIHPELPGTNVLHIHVAIRYLPFKVNELLIY